MSPFPADTDSSSVTTGAILLGAGFSRRFGADKRLQPLAGSTVAETTCDVYTRLFSRVRVVLRPEDRELSAKLRRLNAEIVTTDQAHLGMGHSLAAACANLSWRWAFVGLLDMPFISPDTLKLLITTAAGSSGPAIIRPRLRETSAAVPTKAPIFGHPVGWHHRYFPELRRCHGDTGARELLKAHAGAVVEVIVDDPGIVRDIDTPADLR